MPSGRVHLKIEFALMLCWAVAVAVLIRQGWLGLQDLAVFLGAYLFSMLMLSPDLDLADSRAARRWGWFRWIWKPYSMAFRHRRLSHHVLLGPLTRLGYLALWCAVVLFLLHRVASFTTPGIPWAGRTAALVVVGLFLPNIEHVALDRLASSHRGRRRNRRL